MRCVEAEPFQARRGEYDGVELALVELAHARIDVAAQRLYRQPGIARAQLALPAQAGGADPGARRQRGEVAVAVGEKGVARVLALEHGGERVALRQVRGHVFC